MTQPIATLCFATGKQNSCFDLRVTGIKCMKIMQKLVTQIQAAGFAWLAVEREASDTCVATVGCVRGEILQDADLPRIYSAIEAAGIKAVA